MISRPNGRAPGLIFFNHKGDESGGLVFDANGDNGQFESLTFDRMADDQTIGIQHVENEDGSYFAGMTVWDRPGGARRVTAGTLLDRSATIALYDPNGKVRIRISVDRAGNPKMDFLDETGKVTYSLPR